MDKNQYLDKNRYLDKNTSLACKKTWERSEQR